MLAGVSVCVDAISGVVRNVGNNCIVGGIGVGVCSITGGGADSASASDMPPITRMMETIAIITPPPS